MEGAEIFLLAETPLRACALDYPRQDSLLQTGIKQLCVKKVLMLFRNLLLQIPAPPLPQGFWGNLPNNSVQLLPICFILPSLTSNFHPLQSFFSSACLFYPTYSLPRNPFQFYFKPFPPHTSITVFKTPLDLNLHYWELIHE